MVGYQSSFQHKLFVMGVNLEIGIFLEYKQVDLFVLGKA
jgi:hypothetical protein